MTSVRKVRTAATIILLAGMLLQATVLQLHAQEDGLLSIERPKLGLRASYKYEEEERKAPADTTRTTNHQFRESVPIETGGWIYHPELLEFRLAFEPEWRQETFRQSQTDAEATQTSDKNTSILDYDVQSTLLKHKPVSLNLFGNRKTGKIDFTNMQDSDIESESWGTRLNFTNGTLPVSVGWTRRQFDQTGFYRSQEDRDEAQVRIRHNAKKSTTRLNLLHYDTDRTTSTSFEATDIKSESTSTELTNAYLFTADNRIRLDSQIYNMQADYDHLDQNTWIVTENLFWQHSKNLLSRYRGDYSRREFGESANEEKSLNAALTHHLFDQLTTDLGAGMEANDFEGGSQDTYRSNLGLVYHRPIPPGSVEVGAAYDYGLTRRSGLQNTIPTDTRLSLSTGTESLLEKENIVPESIVVTDLTGATVYTENIDYQVEPVGLYLRIRRTVTGAISEGQQVVVHYIYRTETGYDDSRFGQRYNFSLALWSFLNIAYTHSRIDQDILSGAPPNDPLKDTGNTARLSLLTRWTDTALRYDQQDRSNQNSSVTRSLDQRVNLRLTRSFSLYFTGNIGDRDYTDIGQKEKFYSLGGSVGLTPLWWCHINAVCLCNHISTDQREELDTEVATTVKLTYGVWTGSMTYRWQDQDDKQNGNRLWRQEAIAILTRHLW